MLYSDFLTTSVGHDSLPFCLAVLHPVLAITARHLAITLPPPSDPPLAFLCPAIAGKADRSSPVPPPVPSSTRSCLLYAGRTSVQPAPENRVGAFAAVPFWVRCVSHFHLLYLTTRQAQISRVSLGCKISPIIRLWLTEAGTLSAGFTPRRVPLADACRLIFTPLLRRGPSMAVSGAVKGRTCS